MAANKPSVAKMGLPANLRPALNLGNYCRLSVSNLRPGVRQEEKERQQGASSSKEDTSSSVRECHHCNNDNDNDDNDEEKKKDCEKKVRSDARDYFDRGLRLMMAYQHEEAAKAFTACLSLAPYCALAHGMVALCHAPNYNFKGEPYYSTTDHPDDPILEHYAAADSSVSSSSATEESQLLSVFPNQQVADRHSKRAIQIYKEIGTIHRRKRSSETTSPSKGKGRGGGGGGGKGKKSMAHGHGDDNFHHGSPGASLGKKKKKNGQSPPRSASNADDAASHDTAAANTAAAAAAIPDTIDDVEVQLLNAIRILTGNPGIDATLAEEAVGRPYADAMRKVYQRYPEDAEVAYFFVESLMVLNAWQLYEYPTGRALSKDVDEIQHVLEEALQLHPHHAGLCHMYVHLCEMSSDPGKALAACEPLRYLFPDGGHLVHMPTHIDVLIGDYKACVEFNSAAIDADLKAMEICSDTAGTSCFYFGYIVHNFHMLVYGAILGGMEQKAMEAAHRLNAFLSEDMFLQNPDLAEYLESYAALDLHVLVRFGRWHDILRLDFPLHPRLMLYRTGCQHLARALALCNLGDLDAAKQEAAQFEAYARSQDAQERILHNNVVADLLAVDIPMVRGEIAYFEGRHEEAFRLLRRAVVLQDGLNYDEPWGKMQPIRHALGGLLLEQGQCVEAEQVFRNDLQYHPKNPWSVSGLIACLRKLEKEEKEVRYWQEILNQHNGMEWTDYKVTAPCACCKELSLSSKDDSDDRC